MNFYEKLINIKGLDLNKEIRDVISEVKSYYEDLTIDRTCYIYSSKIYDELKKRGISAHLINTNELDFRYEHYFVLVPIDEKDYYLIDPTYGQFNSYEIIQELLLNSYVKLDNEIWNKYIETIDDSKKIGISEAFYKKKK